MVDFDITSVRKNGYNNNIDVALRIINCNTLSGI
jgi:hypothetical protein